MPYFTFLDYILGPIGANDSFGQRTVHDWIDRLSYYYTTIIILFIFIWVVTEEHAGYPIYCWCPADFTEDMSRYAEDVCWVTNNYYIPFSKPIPPQYEKRNTNEVTYYQFVPFILLAMAILFNIPRHLWKYFAQKSGVQVKKMLAWAKEAEWLTTDEREERLYCVAYYIDSWCSGVNTYRGGICSVLREDYNERCSFGFGRHYGNYLVTLAIGVKFLYFINAIGQLFMLNEFLGGNDYYIYGYEVIYRLFINGTFPPSSRFPIKTLCDFQLRQLNNVQRWTLHCLLPINLFNEKFFVFLWFWISILAIMSFLNLVYASFLIWHRGQKRSFTKKYLYMTDNYDKHDFLTRKLMKKFSDHHLRQDGIYLLKMISYVSGTVIASEVIGMLWEIYLERVRNESLTNTSQSDVTDDVNESELSLLEKEKKKRTRKSYIESMAFPLETAM